MGYSLFQEFFKDLVKIEGGYSDDPRDSGGKTKFGVTEAVARRHGYTGSMRDLSLDLAHEIYKSEYWDALRLDDLQNLSPSLCLKLADIAVNMGQDRAGEFLQRILNVFNNQGKLWPDLIVDGNVGPKTISTTRTFLSKRGHDGELVMIRALNCLQGFFYINLAERRQKDEAFVYGWILNRIA